MAGSAFLIRRAQPDDAPRVRDIIFATLRSYGIEPDAQRVVASLATFGAPTDPDIYEWVAEVDAIPVGSVILGPYHGSEAKLTRLFVDSAYRGRGIGRALLAHAVAEARKQGYKSIYLDSRSVFNEALRLYETTGWVRGPNLPPGPGPDLTYNLTLE